MSASSSSRVRPNERVNSVELIGENNQDNKPESLYGYVHTFFFAIFFAISYFVANILNQYLGYDIEVKPPRFYNYTRSEPYNFKDITGLIEEKSN